jgi:hypothetical protein
MKEKTSNDENIKWNQVCSEKEIRFSQKKMQNSISPTIECTG